jgi:hypothetical protein
MEVQTETTNEPGQVEKTADQLAAESHLDNLTRDDESQVNEQSEAGQGSQAAAIVDPVLSLAGFLQMVGFGFSMSGFPALGAVWSDSDKNQVLASALVPVLAKYAFGQRIIAFLSGETPIEELNLLMVAAPFAMSTVAAFKADKAARQPKDELEPGKVYEVDSPLKSTVKAA